MDNYILEPELLEKGKVWLKHVFNPIVKHAPSSEIYSWDTTDNEWDLDATREPFMVMYGMLSDKTWDGNDDMYDYLLDKMAKYTYAYSHYAIGDHDGKAFDLSPEEIAKILAYMLKSCNIKYDDSSKSEWEIKYFKNTIFGNAIYDAGCTILSECVNNVSDTTELNEDNDMSECYNAELHPSSFSSDDERKIVIEKLYNNLDTFMS